MHVLLKNGKMLNLSITEDIQQGYHDKKIAVIFLTNGTKFIEKFDTEDEALAEVERVREEMLKFESSGGEGGGTVVKGNAELEKDITSNVTCGAAGEGTFFKKGTTLTELAEKLLRKDITPTISTSFPDTTTIKEIGTTLASTTLKLSITNLSKVTVPIKEINFYVENTKIETKAFVNGTSNYTCTYTPTTPINSSITLKAELVYGSNQKASGTGTISFVYASYYGTINKQTLDVTDGNSLTTAMGLTNNTATLPFGKFTKSIKSVKGLTWSGATLNDERYCYLYPSGLGDLSNIKDGNNFEYLTNGSTIKSTITIKSASGASAQYLVYILKDPVTGTNFKFIYS